MADSDIKHVDEKASEAGSSKESTAPSNDGLVEMTRAEEKKLVWKTDVRLVPMLSALFFMAFLDRVNISNAITLGLPEELQLQGEMINVALAVFFAPYIVFEIPSNLLLKRFKPSVWMPLCVFLFGIIMVGQGFVRNAGGLIATRFFLGMVEAGVFPGSFYLMSMWYKRTEALQRFTIFFGAATLAAAFGSLLASGIYKMDGVGGLSGWRWIFVLEGIATCVVAVAGYFLLPNFPTEEAWLSPREKQFMVDRLVADNYSPIMVEESRKRSLIRHLLDPKHWAGCFMYFGILAPAYGMSFFTPTIVKGFGYNNIQTQLHSVPSFAVSWVVAYLVALASDRVGMRSPFIFTLLAISFAMTGVLLNITDNVPVQYGCVFILTVCVQTLMPLLICWYTMNLKGNFERQIGTGWMISIGNFGSFLATFSFIKSDAPKYHRGYSILLVGECIVTAAALVYLVCIWRENRKIAKTTANTDVKNESDVNPQAATQKTYLY